MPKGKGMLDRGKISKAFQADVEALPAEAIKVAEPAEEIQRISITIPEEMLRAIDKYIFEQKQMGVSINRSRFICETLEPKVKSIINKRNK